MSPKSTSAALTPLPDGSLQAVSPVLMPIMAPRLQADITPEGRLDLSLWGSGKIASLHYRGWDGPYVLSPNRLTAPAGGAHVAQSAPVMLLQKTALTSFIAASRCAWWGAPEARRPLKREAGRRIVETGWGVAIAEARGEDLAVAVGTDRAEAEAALRLSSDAIVAESEAYVRGCDRMPEADPLLRSMVSQGVHAGLSSIRKNEHGAFAGLAAGQAYSAPARTYYRDGYWTHQALLEICPEILRDQIEILAGGLQPDGEAPSGVILTGPAQSVAWEKVRRTDPRIKEEHLRPGDWWSDHFDSPLFFVLTVGDYVRATGDASPVAAHLDRLKTIFRRYRAFATEGNGLPLKPTNDRDWADNVYRGGYVAYDLGLWVGALDVMAALTRPLDPAFAEEAKLAAVEARAALDSALLQASGWYADYAASDGSHTEDHLTLDSLTLLRFGAVDEVRAKTVLDHAARMLESRNNAEQPYGDWGVMCAYPPFKFRTDTRAKSAFAYRYHNGSDWPYLSGLYAEERLKRGLAGWRYPLTRWWQTSLENGWAGAVEYFAPPFGRGSLLQGWSGMPAAVALKYRDRILSDRGTD